MPDSTEFTEVVGPPEREFRHWTGRDPCLGAWVWMMAELEGRGYRRAVTGMVDEECTEIMTTSVSCEEIMLLLADHARGLTASELARLAAAPPKAVGPAMSKLVQAAKIKAMDIARDPRTKRMVTVWGLTGRLK